MKIECICGFCKKPLTRTISKTSIYFCGLGCKAQWQRAKKPVTKKWLYKKYVVEKLNCTEIGELTNRDPKSVWNWLKDFNIPTRKRGMDVNQQFKKGQISAFKGMEHTEENKEKMRQARIKEGRIPCYVDGVHWIHHPKFKGRHPASWEGGISPERAASYGKVQWKKAVKAVWERDNAICQRCGLDHRIVDRNITKYHVHHLLTFTRRHTRYEVDNLVLLCDKCHRWVHSTKNKEKLFIIKEIEMEIPECLTKK